ncbi:hypothetical protein PMKS-001855 [Pichia membranifaciens]|uniref:RRM domain-containing protein n=1 Tax=Pichia membranifaciens TaxID=4926 RepID=A0A1Q2YFS0_9ASCO|nr:hypothetical protein PMKS-001855 [Pichia membranifaciens]
MEKVQKRRLHVGGLSKELTENITELEQRFSKVGQIVEPFEIHEKSVLEYNFAYVTMELNDSQLRQLKKLWNDVRYMGSKLSIGIAKDTYLQRWEKDSRRQDTKILSRERRSRVTERRLARIAQRDENPFKLALVTKGRLRASPRTTDLKNLTLRVSINGRLKVIKCKKTKLWGMDKNKAIRDLTSRFIAGEWRDANDHVIDRLTRKMVIFDDGKILVKDTNVARAADIQEELEEEQNKTNKVLEDMLNKYNFEKPVELEDDNKNDNNSDFDYELENRVAETNLNDDEHDNNYSEELALTYNIIEKDCLKPSRESVIQEYKSYGSQFNKEEGDDKEEEEEEEEDDDEEFFNNLKPTLDEEAQPEGYGEDPVEENSFEPASKMQSSPSTTRTEESNDDKNDDENEGENDDEFIPTFGSTKADDENDDEFIPTFGSTRTGNETEAPITNTTEKLRALLSAGTSSSATEKMEQDNIVDNARIETVLPNLKKSKNVGLFFSHFDSPFLVAQSQINKLRELNANEELKYDEWFWSNRGELNREFRRLRRDVLRRNKKKSKTPTTFI